MMRVSDPIHEAQPWTGPKAFAEMILDQDCTANACRFTQEHMRIYRVMQDVDEHYDIEGTAGMRDGRTIEWPNGNLRLWSHKDINSLNGQVRPLLQYEAIDGSVPASDIKNPGSHGNQTGEMIRQDAYPAWEDKLLV
jgi:hypothetical protein